jgi:hypothetical protein
MIKDLFLESLGETCGGSLRESKGYTAREK